MARPVTGPFAFSGKSFPGWLQHERRHSNANEEVRNLVVIYRTDLHDVERLLKMHPDLSVTSARPEENCIMFTRYDKFCAVCRRAIERIIGMYT